MPLNLVPETRKRGEHGDKINVALLDTAAAKAIELMLAIDDQTGNGNCLKGYLQGCIDRNEMVDPMTLSMSIDCIWKELAGIHAFIVAARCKEKK